MIPKDTGYAYVGKRPCGCIRMAAVEAFGEKEAVSAFVAKIIKSGLTLERVTVEAVRTGFTSCDACREPKQGDLFQEVAA